MTALLHKRWVRCDLAFLTASLVLVQVVSTLFPVFCPNSSVLFFSAPLTMMVCWWLVPLLLVHVASGLLDRDLIALCISSLNSFSGTNALETRCKMEKNPKPTTITRPSDKINSAKKNRGNEFKKNTENMNHPPQYEEHRCPVEERHHQRTLNPATGQSVWWRECVSLSNNGEGKVSV
ncbi:hypothetical protein PIB30_081464 [Stylosanthes scabra]|uniref:Uncharacterized protein n=1 Tax=Stylosanthes scabra TaxID=79078 RepID=A0ABU6SRV8_9FABA|nr:hypothetical protein [Stylosanthes scabra]